MDWDDLMGSASSSRSPPTGAPSSRTSCTAPSCNVGFHVRRPGASDTMAVAAHPGIAASRFWENAAGPRLRLAARVVRRGIALMFSTAAQGAEPIVYAATADDVLAGRCYGPRIAQRWGRPGLVETSTETRGSGGRSPTLGCVRGAHRCVRQLVRRHVWRRCTDQDRAGFSFGGRSRAGFGSRRRSTDRSGHLQPSVHGGHVLGVELAPPTLE